MTKKLTILVDMDSIIVALTQKWLELYNAEHGDTVIMSDVKKWDMSHNVKIGQDIYKYLYRPGLFEEAQPLPGALEALKEIHKKGHHIVIVSAPSHPGNSASAKISWIRQHMPWFNKRDIILGHHKHLVKGDVFIDDSPDNIELYRRHWKDSTIMTIAYPYNEEVKTLVDIYAEDFQNTEKAWARITGEIQLVANLK